ncbi:HET-domain-containing protein, partial [Zopfia rhizophila CBS 207.26]
MSKSNAYDSYFKYTPLPKQWIRLLKIHDSLAGNLPRDPSELQKSIRISFEDHELSSCPPYIALSYTWGQPTQIVDPTLRVFTQESSSTLKTWADLSGGKPELYWIDALCINQDDKDERSVQVVLMGSIYKQATVCLVWLGEKDDFTGIAMSTAVKLWNKLRNLGGISPHLSVVEQGNILRARMQELLDLPQPEFKALVVLFSRTWFSRLWIVQEVVLA